MRIPILSACFLSLKTDICPSTSTNVSSEVPLPIIFINGSTLTNTSFRASPAWQTTLNSPAGDCYSPSISQTLLLSHRDPPHEPVPSHNYITLPRLQDGRSTTSHPPDSHRSKRALAGVYRPRKLQDWRVRVLDDLGDELPADCAPAVPVAQLAQRRAVSRR